MTTQPNPLTPGLTSDPGGLLIASVHRLQQDSIAESATSFTGRGTGVLASAGVDTVHELRYLGREETAARGFGA